MTQKLNYRNEIDGIRAVSIIAVLINHIIIGLMIRMNGINMFTQNF